MTAPFDNAASAGNNTSASSISVSHVLGKVGGSGLIVVGVSCRTTVANYGNGVVTGVTYNGVAMTKIREDGNNGGSQATHVSLWGLWGASVPAAGTYTVTASYTGATDYQAIGVMSFSNVKPQTAEANNSVSLNGNSTPSTSLTTLTGSALLVSIYGNQNAFQSSSSTGDTAGFHTSVGCDCDGFYGTIGVPASSTVTLSVSNPEAEALVIASFATIPVIGFPGI